MATGVVQMQSGGFPLLLHTHTRRVSPPLTQLLRVGTLSVRNAELWSVKDELQ